MNTGAGVRARQLGVCGWSLRPRSARELAARLRACAPEGPLGVQVALDPIRQGLWDERETLDALHAAGVEIISGMMAPAREDYTSLESIRRTGGLRPDATWEENRRAARDNAAVAARLGVTLVSLHAGHVPEGPDDPLRAAMLSRLREVCGAFAARGVRVALETGQDTPRAMVGVLETLRDLGVGVNFDPANAVLYASADPIDALRELAAWVVQVHLKDAVAPDGAGRWGREVPAGRGEVDWASFFGILRERLPGVAVVVEREAGEDRVGDVAAGLALARRMLEGEG